MAGAGAITSPLMEGGLGAGVGARLAAGVGVGPARSQLIRPVRRAGFASLGTETKGVLVAINQIDHAIARRAR